MKAVWNNQIIAESENTVVVEGNHYFPPGAIKREFLKKSQTHTRCPWKGEAHYYSIVVHGEQNTDAAWYYPSPKQAALAIKNHLAFWKGVVIID